MNPGDLRKIFNQLFSKEEQQKIMELESKPFDEKMDGLAEIFENNARIPQGKVMAQAFRDPEIRQDMREIEEAAQSGNLSQQQLMQRGMKLAMKMRGKYGI
ncbi:MAG: hypothetical protein EA357_07450 [Micavibrio sp.]|nr:MAG: hypothetical protein EA357_07450 [Micavibrio sp.]